MRKRFILVCTLVVAAIYAMADVTISPTSRNFEANGGGATISTIGTGAWTATTEDDWIQIVKASGSAGEACTYLVKLNSNADTRTGYITINGSVFTVTQRGCDVSLSPISASFDRNGGNGTITAQVDAGVHWTAAPSDAWIGVNPIAGNGPTVISFTVSPFDAVGSRYGTIRIGSESFAISQAGVDVTLSPASTNVTKDVGIVAVQVIALSESHWTVAPNASWISVLDGGNGFGGSQITLAVAANPSYAKRTGTVSIGSATLTILQDGTDDLSFKILPEEAEASPTGAFGNVAVYATPDATWTAESMDDWIRVTSGDSGAGNGNLKYVTLSNPNMTERTGRIKFVTPVAVPDLDLYAGLLFWIKEQNNIEGNETRQTTYPLSKAFDGSFSNPLKGTILPARDTSDYALCFSFRVGGLDAVNRLLKIGNDSLYLNSDNVLCYNDFQTSYVADSTADYHTVVLNVDGNHKLDIYAGVSNSELQLVGSKYISSYLTFESGCAMSSFLLGYATYPSTGYLQSGSIGNIRFWSRSLTQKECINADLKQDTAYETKPLGNVSDAKYYYMPFSGNMYAYSSEVEGPISPSDGTMLKNNGFVMASGRDRIENHAVAGTMSSVICFTNLAEQIDTGFSIVSEDKIWSNYALSYYASDTYSSVGGSSASGMTGYNMYRPPQPTPTCSEDCTFSFWICPNNLQDGSVLFARSLSQNPTNTLSIRGSHVNAFEQNIGSITNNFKLIVSFESNGRLKIAQETCKLKFTRIDSEGPVSEEYRRYTYSFEKDKSKETIFNSVELTPSSWVFVTIVGRSQQSITIYINGNEVGNCPSKMWFGAMPPVDGRAVGRDETHWPLIADKHIGTLYWHTCAYEIGGFGGAIDDFTFYNKALSAKEVKAIYEAGLPVEEGVYHTVHQGIQEPELTPDTIEIGQYGGTTNINFITAKNVNWFVTPNVDWLSVSGSTSGTGPVKLSVSVAANPLVVPRIGTMWIGSKILTVRQEGLGCEVSCDQTVFGVDSDVGYIDVSPAGNGYWEASTDVDWIYLADTSGTGSGDIMFFVDYFADPGSSRTGAITVGEKTVYITQRGYDLSIEPMICEVGGNAGAGEIGVAADLDGIWSAVALEPWITIVQGGEGIGSGIVRYRFSDNTTGETRTGHINISGKMYTLTQTCTLKLSTSVVGQGTVVGGGDYAQGSQVELTATPASGYVFSHWSGDMVGVEPQQTLLMDSVKNVTATFIPESAAEQLASTKAAQGGFYTRDQIHALEMGNLVLDVDSATGMARIGVQLMETSDLSDPDGWVPVGMTTSNIDVGSDGTVGMKVPATGNAKFFKVVVPEKK